MNMPITGNRGEWSEIYTLLKVLGDKALFAGNDAFERVDNLLYPIVRVLRSEPEGNYEYCIYSDIVLVTSSGKQLLSLPVSEFAEKATLALTEIQRSKKERTGSFSIPELELFMKKIHCSSLKASSSAKTDITIVIHDEKTNQTPVLGFSIKSQLGNASTLLNASKATNFKYELNGITKAQSIIINDINTRSKIIDRINYIMSNGGTLKFKSIPNRIFSNNLTLIDSLLPNIIAELVYKYFTTSDSTIDKLVATLENNNPLDFDKTHAHSFYTYKLKKFLTDAALGLMPTKIWDGHYDATGGYLVVKEDGDVLCYHLYNRNEFEQYLFSNTKLETASSSRHDFGSVYEEGGQFYFNLNLQIRFIK